VCRDIKDLTAGTLSQHITQQAQGLKALESHLKDTSRYLDEVARGELPLNHSIIYLLQDVMNLLPDVAAPDFVGSVNVQTNDQLLLVYLGSLIRSVIALHNLINNKLSLREAERKEGDKSIGGVAGAAKDKPDKKSTTASDKPGDSGGADNTSASSHHP